MNTELKVVQRTNEWHEVRNTLIVTGSTIGAILGHNKHESTENLLRKVVRQILGAPSEFVMNDDVQRGIDREPVTMTRVENELGIIFREAGVFVHPEWDWIGVSPDPIAIDGSCGLEIKNPRKIQPLSEKPNYEDQIRLCQEVTGIRDYYYVSDAGDETPLHIEKVEYDPEWFGKVFDRLVEFKELVDKELESPERHLEPLVKQMTGSTWELAASDYIDAKKALDDAKAKEEKLRKRLIDLAEERSAEGFGVKLTRVDRVGSIDYSKVPEIKGVDLEQYRKKGSTSYRITISD